VTRKIKFALIGCGLFGERILVPAFRKSSIAELIAITKRDIEPAFELVQKYGIPLAYSYDELPKLLKDPEIEAVFIATPNAMHYNDAIAALKAGKHVLLEKPMALNAAQCEEILETSKQANKKLMIAHNFRFTTSILYVKQLIDDGKLGKLIMGTCDFMTPGMHSSRKWKYNKNIAGGGASFDLAVHSIDILRFLNPSPLRSLAHVHKPDPLPNDTVDEFALFVLNFENGFIGRAVGSFFGPIHSFLEIYGTKGRVRVIDWHIVGKEVEIFQEIGVKTETITVKNEDHYKTEIDAFAQSIMNNSPVPIPGEEGLVNQKIIDLVNN
jgi:predicted dehydrogenase